MRAVDASEAKPLEQFAAALRAQFFDDILDALHIVLVTDQQCVTRVDDDDIIHIDQCDQSLVTVYNIVAAVQ